MKTALIIIGVLVFIVIAVFLYLLIAGADESRRRDNIHIKRNASSIENHGENGK